MTAVRMANIITFRLCYHRY